MDLSIDGKVALVTGSSKAIGRGIALELGERGATVYLSARSPEGLAETARQIAELGGTAIAVPTDHDDDAQVEALFSRIASEAGRIDIVVNNASPDFSAMVGKAFWDLPFDEITKCLNIGPRSGFVATALAARMMIPEKSGLIVNVSSHGSRDYLLSVPYGIGKAAIEKLTHDTALELREHNVAVVSLWPGLVLTERIMGRATRDERGRLTVAGLDISFGESPRFSGRAIIALAKDPDVMSRTGQAYFASTLGREYNFTDVDGNQPQEISLLSEYLGEERIPPYWKQVERFGRGFRK